MHRTLSRLTRYRPLRVLTLVACWLMLANPLWAYLPSAQGEQVAAPTQTMSMHSHASMAMHGTTDAGCCAGHTDRHAGHLGMACHCASSCTGLLMPTTETASLSVMPETIDVSSRYERARSLTLQPPLRPPAV
jgi:hypothetical protein